MLVYTPFGHRVLGTEPLPAWIWEPLIVGAAGLLLAEELRKALTDGPGVKEVDHA